MELKTRIAVGDYHLAFQSWGAGGPTVVFESGGDCGADSLANLARQVRAFTRTLIYDRAGLGASDPASRPRTIQDAVDDLHTLLHAAQIPGPYLLVGHSLGGLIVRRYTGLYLHEVMGMVWLDVPHPEQAAIELVERLGAMVIGVACLHIAPSVHQDSGLTHYRLHWVIEY